MEICVLVELLVREFGDFVWTRFHGRAGLGDHNSALLRWAGGSMFVNYHGYNIIL